MKHSQHYFSNTKITLYALFLCMIPTGANAQLFGGMMKASKNITTINIGIPASITLGQNASYFVASVYDDHYLPFTVPTGPATTGVLNVGTGNPLINVQGAISTTGITVSIPVTCTGSSTLPAYSATVTIPAGMTQDGIARDLTLSWASQAYTATTTKITATLKAVGGTLNAKKLDINAGMGSDNLGVLLGNLVYPYNNAGTTSNFAVRDIAGIPDKMYGLADNGGIVRHNFLYLPVTGEDGKLWLNNNLGADYANANSASFNPTQQATSATDFKAYGSLFQWGRKPDGHELITWTGTDSGTAVNTAVPTQSNVPAHDNFIGGFSNWWVLPDPALWNNAESVNNPCPSGFRVPNDGELTALFTAANITAVNTLATAAASRLHFSVPGAHYYSTDLLYGAGRVGDYWSSTANNLEASSLAFWSGKTLTAMNELAYGFLFAASKTRTFDKSVLLRVAGRPRLYPWERKEGFRGFITDKDLFTNRFTTKAPHPRPLSWRRGEPLVLTKIKCSLSGGLADWLISTWQLISGY